MIAFLTSARFNPGSFYRRLGLAVLMLLTPLLALASVAPPTAQAGTFGSAAFATVWQRADRPVESNQAQPGRSWLWGPSLQIASEPYQEGFQQQRLVQYFDKGRLERTDPTSDYVSSGLLVRELIGGQIQLGNTMYQLKAAPPIALAGDYAGNNPSPTYQTLAAFASLNNDHPTPDQTGQNVVQTLNKAGQISQTITPPALVKLVQFESTLKHNIPDVFWAFMQQRGTVWQDGEYVLNQLLFNWQEVVGLPLTEPYWTTALVSGLPRNVLVQAFERRVLTFTPDNPDPFKVEMGNVGRHYYQWRYEGRSAPPPSDVAPPRPTADSVVLANFPIYSQQHNLSCEYAATRMMTAFWGQPIGEAQFIREIPVQPDPHVGYRGDIDGPFGGTWDYGIYAEPIAKMLETHGFKTKLLTGGLESLKQELRQGRPVQVWIIAGFGYGNPFTSSYDGLNFKLAAGEHSVDVYGYDNHGLYIADPAYGGRSYVSYATFMRNWDYFNEMALSIWPDGVFQPSGPNWGVSPYFYRYWLNSNGAALYGLPIAPPQAEGTLVTQYFARARLEYDRRGPYNQPIALGMLGRELTAGREHETPFVALSQNPNNSNSLFFQATFHTLTGGFRTFWEQQGGLEVFGYPISQEFVENGLTVQYFERARFEYHPDLPEGTKVTLGRVGAERLNQK